jgi:hypothetical protein
MELRGCHRLQATLRFAGGLQKTADFGVAVSRLILDLPRIRVSRDLRQHMESGFGCGIIRIPSLREIGLLSIGIMLYLRERPAIRKGAVIAFRVALLLSR